MAEIAERTEKKAYEKARETKLARYGEHYFDEWAAKMATKRRGFAVTGSRSAQAAALLRWHDARKAKQQAAN